VRAEPKFAYCTEPKVALDKKACANGCKCNNISKKSI
jgi:hypothetical protein